MAKRQGNACEYCGSNAYAGKICAYCYEKRRLIRKIQAMVRNYKEGLEGSKNNESKN